MGTIVGASDESYMRLVDNIGRGETMLGMYEQSNFRNICQVRAIIGCSRHNVMPL